MSNILKGIVNEAHYPEDPDEYEAMFGARRRPNRMEPDEPQEPYNPMDDYYKKQDAAQAKYNKEVKVEYSDKEGVAPNGERYNSMFVVRAANPYQGDNEIRKFEDLHWGAKKIVDTVKKETKDVNQSFLTAVYYVDNHKYGMWRPWKDEAPTQKPLTFENPVEQFGQVLEGISQEDLANTLCHRIEMRYPDIYKKYDYDTMYNAVDDVASFHAGAEELGSSDINMMIRQVFKRLEESEGLAEGSSSKLSSPFEGGRRTTSITPKHKPLVWENMLGTVMAKDPASKAEPKYFDYKWDDARAYAKVDQCDDLRICKSPGLYQGWPEKGKMALWGILRKGVAEGFPHDVDHMPGKTTKHTSTNCTTCHGRKSMYKLGGKLFADNKQGAVKVKCPTCKGTGDKQGVAEEKGTLWRVQQSEATGRYHVVKGYNKDMKMFKNKMGAGDFNSKDAAQAKADELNSSVKETFYRNPDGSIRVVDHKRESKELNVGDTFEYGFFGTKKGIGTVVKLEGFPGKEFVVGKTMDGKITKFPYRGAMPKNGYYIKKIKSNNTRQSELNEAVDESWINAYKALEANGGEPTLDKPRLFIQQMAMMAKDLGLRRYSNNIEQFIHQYIGGDNPKLKQYNDLVNQVIDNAPSMTEIKKYAQQSQSQDVAYQQQQQMSALQHDLTIQQLLRKNELEKADSDALVQMDFEARQAIKERQQQLELEAKEKLAQIEIDIRNSREPEEVRKHELEMARLNHAHEVQVIRVTAEGEMKKAQLEADYQIKIKQLENIDNQQERQNRLDVINTEKYKELARIDAETSAKVKELQAETNAEREKAEIEISSQQAQSDIRIREEFMNEFKPIWANLIQRASEAGRTIGQNISAMMAALSRMGKPTMPQANKINELKCWDGYKRVPGTKAGAPGSCEEIEEGDLNELSTDRLAKYKTASAADARAADKAGDFARGNKRFAGIVKATKKQFDNETKPKKESAIMKGLVDENLGTPYPGTYEQEFGPFKRKGSERTMKLTTEGKKNVSRRT